MKYHVTFEFRYTDVIQGDSWYVSRINTIGVYDTIEEAIQEGNKIFPLLEEKFPLNPNYNVKRRFSKQNLLISEIDYIKTPFCFFAQITELKYNDIASEIEKAEKARTKYKQWRIENE